MIHPQYLVENGEVMLHEICQHLSSEDPRFIVRAVHFGGMGMCVRLQHVLTGEEFAVKNVLPGYLGNKEAIDRFADELKVWLSASACSLVAEATGIVSINESPCVLAPWMKGGDLAGAMERMPFQQRFQTLIRMVRALRWVHENLRVIHRDLKPGNILLDENGLAYVADWGLARPLSQAFAGNFFPSPPGAIFRPDRTQAGSFVGTLRYAAPEQIRNLGVVDHRADIYALGCIMYEMETGRPPFIGQTREELVQQQLFAEPPKIGWSLTKKSLGLSKIIDLCLKKNPGERWATYAELESILLQQAAKQQVDLTQCALGIRYERSVLGEGLNSQRSLVKSRSSKKGFAIIEFDEMKKYHDEAHNLIGAKRYKEAADLLASCHIVELLDIREASGSPW